MTDWLPNAQLAIIDERKITEYLLATSHSAGGAKPEFFARFGFTSATWQRLRDALLDHAGSARLVTAVETQFGKKYILEGPLIAADGRKPRVRTVWFITAGEVAPKFVTAYPVPGARR